MPEIRARANLSTSVWRLRQAISRYGVNAEIVRATENAIGINADLCEVDVDAFRHDSVAPGGSANTLDTLARAAYATGLYRGDLLEDWDLEWCRLEREQLRQRFVHTLRAQAEGFERLGRYDLALQYARRAADAEPSDEPAQRTLIRLLMRTGDRGSAARQFHRFAGYVRSELGVEPDGQTVALFGQAKEASSDQWLDQAAEPRVPLIRPGMIPLVGRIEEREQISGLLDGAMAGNGRSILVLGEAGIGKSKLVEWAMEEWAARGGITARGRCIEFIDPIPYQPILDAIGCIADVTGITGFASGEPGALPITPEDLTVGAISVREGSDRNWPPGKLRLFGWLLTRLEKAGRHRPLLIVVEDLQWADASTMDFLAYMLERAPDRRLLILVTARPSGSRIRHDAGVERVSRYCAASIQLGPLTPAETSELVHVLIGKPQIATRMQGLIYPETEGNPLFIIETIRLLEQQGRLTQSKVSLNSADDPGRIMPGSAIPDGVRLAVEQRLRLLDSAALRVARIASVLGRSFDEELLSMVAGVGANRLSQAIGLLIHAGIFDRENASYRFTHDKIRAVCYENLQVRLRRVYHARAAAALSEMSDVPIQRLAWHQLSAGQWNLAASSWERAGDHARAVHAYEEAFGAYQHAIKCMGSETREATETMNIKRIRLLFKCDEVLAVLGRPSDRRTILNRAGALCQRIDDSSLQTTLFIRRALLENYVGSFTLGVSLARRAWSVARVEHDRSREVDALLVLAFMLYRVERYRRSLAVSRLALRRIGDVRSPLKVAALLNAAAVHVIVGDFALASSRLEQARDISIELGLQAELCQVMSRRALLDKFAGEVQRSRTGFVEALKLANEAQELVWACRITTQLATLDALEGKLGDAIRRLRQAMLASRNLGYTWTEVVCLNEVGYGVGRLLGNYSWAWDASVHALRLPGALNSRYLSWIVRDTQALLLLEQVRFERAMTEIQEVLKWIEPLRASTAFLESLARRGVIWLQLGDPSKALTDLEQARWAQVESGQRLLLVDTLTYLAMAHAALDDANRALATSNDALSLLTEIGYANHQPQRVFWHHYLILKKFNREPRLPYLKRAVEYIEAQAATLSKAQARRLKRDVRLNREILEAWERHRQDPGCTVGELAIPVQAPTVPVPAVPAT
ncbi:MAG TPA: AAA family ATPase [Nitrospiraceae bacterium]|nr:AAA family ATPase [Nitrospiraceae bacterium]